MYENKGHIWPLFLMMSFILAFAALKTGSRSWLMAMALVVAVMAFSTKRFVWLMVGVVGIAILSWIFKDQIASRGISYRDEIWLEGIRQGIDRPWGQGSVAELQVLRWREPHNIFLTIWLKYGVVPMTLFSVSLVWLVNTARMAHPKKYFEWLLPLVFGLSMLFFEGANVIHKPNESWLLIWIPICLMLAGKMESSSRENLVNIGRRV